MELDFGQKQDGFQIKGTTLKGFTIAGPDRVFYPAEAMVHDGKLYFLLLKFLPLLLHVMAGQIIRIVICTERTGSRLPFPDRLLVDGVSLNLFSFLYKLMEASPSS